jgi:hypothetical protein
MKRTFKGHVMRKGGERIFGGHVNWEKEVMKGF